MLNYFNRRYRASDGHNQREILVVITANMFNYYAIMYSWN
jgi:hypothetical protein